MGLLSRLLNPKHHLRALVDPAGATISAASGRDPLDTKSLIDPAGAFMRSSPKSDPAAQQQDDLGVTDPSLYMGDESDPEYGSFTDPFDVEAFYEYQDPGYAFELQQGTQALMNSAAAGSGSMSGAALKDLLKYSQGFARTGYNDAFNRYQVQQGNIFGRLSDIARLGQSAAAGVGSAGTAAAGNAGQFLSDAGSAYGGGIVGAGNALGQGATNYWLMKDYLKQPGVAGAGTGSV